MASVAENVDLNGKAAADIMICENGATEPKVEKVEEEMKTNGNDTTPEKPATEMAKKEEMPVEIEPKTGLSFPVKLDDGKQLLTVGLRKKSMLGMGIKIYGFGVYAENEKMKELLKLKIGKAPGKPTKEMYQAVTDSDLPMVVRMVIVFSKLTMNMVKKSFDEGLGASIQKLTGGKKNDELATKVMGQASDDIKLPSGSVIEISRLPGYVLQTKVKDEVVSEVESELLCRAFIQMYVGEDPFDKDAKEKFGISLLSLSNNVP